MDKTDYELSLMTLESHEPEIMKRMRAGVFTADEAGYLIAGICNVLQDLERDGAGCLARMNRVATLVDGIIGEEKIEDLLR